VKALAFRVEGKVQGVWFRAFTRDAATRLGLAGWVRNDPDGAVSGEVEGAEDAVDGFIEALREGPVRARVDAVHVRPVASAGAQGFSIRY
jgi:acylphosphatase